MQWKEFSVVLLIKRVKITVVIIEGYHSKLLAQLQCQM
jgi:hypothetical protein